MNRTEYTDVKDLDLGNHRKNQKMKSNHRRIINNHIRPPSNEKIMFFVFFSSLVLVYYYAVAIVVVVVGDDCATRNKIQQPTRFLFGWEYVYLCFVFVIIENY